MDWIRLGNSGVDLSGTGGRIVPVTKDELVKHNKKNDAWMAIQGVVYNVSKYMDFHPGGAEELMRGIGSDATKLFNDIHPWVNYAQLLNKCRIGPLVNPVRMKPEIKDSLILPNRKTTNSFMQDADISPRLDWIQKRDEITLYFYTKLFCNPGCLIRNLNEISNYVEIWIFISHYVHTFHIQLQGHVKWPPKIFQVSSESGKIEIKLNKLEEQQELWSNLGMHKQTKYVIDNIETYFEVKLMAKKQFNSDSSVILMENKNMVYKLPVGYHVTIDSTVNDMKISKAYTPVPKKYCDEYLKQENDKECQYFLIKQYLYPNSFSKHLCNSEIDTLFKISLPKGNFSLSILASHRRFCFLAAGSGLTPFLGLIDHLLKRNTNRIEILKILYFNKTKADIWCHEILTNLSKEDMRLEFINILSNGDALWSGLKGKVSSELLHTVTNKSMNNITYIATCGPSSFNISVEKILNDLEFPKKNIFIF
ncbi:cytochrome b5 reductase 4 isoform 2-T6 [Cochliomyia hominivorax]